MKEDHNYRSKFQLDQFQFPAELFSFVQHLVVAPVVRGLCEVTIDISHFTIWCWGWEGRDYRTATDMFYSKLYIDFRYSLVSFLMDMDIKDDNARKISI